MTTCPIIQPEALLSDYQRVRGETLHLCEPLAAEDMVVQTMPDVSPTKWHLAHVTWFFETFVLAGRAPGYRRFDRRYHRLFNSYYRTVGQPHPRHARGLLSRPTVQEILDYRTHVDAAMQQFLELGSPGLTEDVAHTVMVGLHHEQQHQELLLMDIKHVLGQNPLRPAYQEQAEQEPVPRTDMRWCPFKGGVVAVGATQDSFSYDNETPRHEVLLQPFELASRPVTTGEWQAFMDDGGYRRCDLWLADGWDLVQREGWRAPLYWEEHDRGWQVLTLGGLLPLNSAEPVCHISYYEADAYARWAGHRLPTEAEWEHAVDRSQESSSPSGAGSQPQRATLLESGRLHPAPLEDLGEAGLRQTFGEVWEWTGSPYMAYPGYEPYTGSLGEYNGKFMSNQMVLRGGCCVTPADHLRSTYRNFYYPHQRWMFAGVRLAR